MKDCQILPLAVTKVTDVEACVAGLDNQNRWVRLGPAYVSDLEKGNFMFYRPVKISCRPSDEEGARPEDYIWNRSRALELLPELAGDEVLKRIHAVVDQDLDTAFEQRRTVCIVRAELKDVTYGKVLGRKNKFRAVFCSGGKEYNFIIGDYFFLKHLEGQLEDNRLSVKSRNTLLKDFCGRELHLAISLTQKTVFPGPYHGCHAIISGFHLFPHNAF